MLSKFSSFFFFGVRHACRRFVRSFVPRTPGRADATRRDANRIDSRSHPASCMPSHRGGVGLRHVAIERVGWHPVLARQAAALSSDGSTSRIPPFD